MNSACVAVTALALTGLWTAQAQQERRKWAVIVGINDYAHPKVRDLKYAVPDARALHGFLVDEAGFPADNVRLLVNEQATLREIKRALGDFVPARADANDMVVLFFAGHGAPETSAAEPDGYAKYLIPYDADPESLYSTALPMDELQRIFQRIRAATLVLIADACYSGASGGRTFGAPAGTRMLELNTRFLDELAKAPGRIIVTASGPNEVSREDDRLGHGLFTHHLLEGLRGKADRDSDSVLTLREGYDYACRQVFEASKGQQRPVWKGEEAGPVALVDRRARIERASLVIQTQPPGASIFLGGVMRGVARPELIVPGLPAGEHEVIAKLEGFAETRRKVTVSRDAPPVSITLPATRGGLRITSTPAGAKVIVDGIERGQTELALNDLAPGAHQVEVTMTGYAPTSRRTKCGPARLPASI